jgi:hypothetical protein
MIVGPCCRAWTCPSRATSSFMPQRELGCGDVVAVGLQGFGDGAPAGAIRPRPVDKDDVRHGVHVRTFLVRRRSAPRRALEGWAGGAR